MELSRCSATLNIDDWSSKIASLLLSVLLPLCYRNTIPSFTSCLTQNKIAPSFFQLDPQDLFVIWTKPVAKMLLIVKSLGEQLSLRDTVVSKLFDVKQTHTLLFLFGYPKTSLTIKMLWESSFLSGSLSDCHVLVGSSCCYAILSFLDSSTLNKQAMLGPLCSLCSDVKETLLILSRVKFNCPL